jgi:hypothetical protein
VGEESGEGAGLPGRGARGKRWRRRAGVGAATAVAAGLGGSDRRPHSEAWVVPSKPYDLHYK